jgi:hypothetical protein
MFKKKLILRLQGGLGNQLFQYATARALCLEKNMGLIIECSSFENDPYQRTCALSSFKIKAKIIKSGVYKKIVTPGNRIYANALRFNLIFNEIEQNFKLHENLFPKPRLINSIIGYWQSSYYFQKYDSIIRRDLQLKSKVYLSNIINSSKPIISLHVRRLHGTYFEGGKKVIDERYGVLPIQYYISAINYFKQRINDFTVLVFSDDIDWCKKNLAWVDYFISDLGHFNDIEQLVLMSQAHHYIIANSTYSWWGVWLNSNKSKIVVCPSKPYQDESILYENYYPNDWIKI